MHNIGSWIRAKWGRFCLLLFALGMAIAMYTMADMTAADTTTRPSSEYGFYEFFGQRENAAKGVIKEAPPKIRLVLDKGETLEIDMKNVGAAVTPGITIELSGKDLIVDDVNFTMVEQKMQQLSHDPLFVRSIDGGIEVDHYLDVSSVLAVQGIYEVKNNVIVRHYYSVVGMGGIWGVLLALLVLIITPAIYVIGKVVIMTLDRREQRDAKG